MARFLPFSAACSPLCQNLSRKKAKKMPSMPSGRQRHRGLPLEALPRKSFAAMCQAAAISFTAFRTGRGKPPCQPILSESGCPSGKESGHCFVGIPFFESGNFLRVHAPACKRLGKIPDSSGFHRRPACRKGGWRSGMSGCSAPEILAGDNQPLWFIKKLKITPRIGKIALVRKDFIPGTRFGW